MEMKRKVESQDLEDKDKSDLMQSKALPRTYINMIYMQGSSEGNLNCDPIIKDNSTENVVDRGKLMSHSQ